MTKKDYIKIALAIAYAQSRSGSKNSNNVDLKTLVHTFADMLANDNPRFDRNRFIDYVYQTIDGTKG